MGWASGSSLFRDLILTVKKNISSNAVRKRIYDDMLESFESYDWDTQNECLGIDVMFDELWEEKCKERGYDE